MVFEIVLDEVVGSRREIYVRGTQALECLALTVACAVGNSVVNYEVIENETGAEENLGQLTTCKYCVWQSRLQKQHIQA